MSVVTADESAARRRQAQVVGANIIRARDELEPRMGQARLARLLGIAQPRLSEWENGKRLPGWAYIERLADIFGKDPTWFHGRHGDEGPEQ